MTTCRHCGGDIVRRLVAGIETWGHVANPGPAHHYAKPSTPTQADHLTNPRTQVGPPASLPKARLAAK